MMFMPHWLGGPKQEVLDALELGSETILPMNPTLEVVLRPGDSRKAIEETVLKGAWIVMLPDMPEKNRLSLLIGLRLFSFILCS